MRRVWDAATTYRVLHISNRCFWECIILKIRVVIKGERFWKGRIYREALGDACFTHSKVTNKNDFVDTSNEKPTVRKMTSKVESAKMKEKKEIVQWSDFLLSHMK